MNPLMIAANAAALLSLVVKVQSLIHKYRAEFPSQHPEREDVMQELGLLRQALKTLERRSAKSSVPMVTDVQSLEELKKIFEECVLTIVSCLDSFADRSMPASSTTQGFNIFSIPNTKIKNAKALNPWPISDTQAAKLLEKLQFLRSGLVDFTSSGILSSSSVPPTPAIMSSALSTRDDILQWLSTVNYKDSHMDSLEIWTPGTCTWILEDEVFKKWHEPNHSMETDILLCVGPAGAGKTILTSRVIEYVEKQSSSEEIEKTGLAYFYFNYQTWSTISVVLGTLLKELALRKPWIPEPVYQMWKVNKHDQLPPQEEMCAALIATCGHFDNCYIILEAIDECPEENFQTMTQLLRVLKSAVCKVFISLRDDNETRLRKLHDLLPNAREICSKAKTGDIELFVRWKLQESKGLASLLDDSDPLTSVTCRVLEDRICKVIVNSANGSFLLPSLQMRKVLDQTTRAELEEILAQLPPDPDEYYREIMENILDLPESRARLARRTFMWLVQTSRPLTVAELRHALAIEVNSRFLDERNMPSLNTIIAVCKGMVTVDRQKQRISLLHTTFQEFLNINQDSFFPESNETLARACTTYLLFDGLKGGPCRSRDELTARLDKYPLLPYLSHSWGFHSREFWKGEAKDSTMKILRDGSLLDSLSQVFYTTANHRRFVEKFAVTPRGLTGLHIAGYFGHVEAAKALTISKPGLLSAIDSWKRTPLHMASEYGQYGMVKYLLEQHASTDVKDSKGKTPLHAAASNGHESVVYLLLKKKADATVEDDENRTALDLAAAKGEIGVVEKLLDAADGQYLPKASAVRKAAATGESKMVEVLLDKGVQPDADTLTEAASSGIQDTVNVLLEHGMSPNIRGAKGQTPLHAAAAAGHANIVHQLLESGADLSLSDEQNKTPLYFAAANGDEKMVKQLLEEGATIDARTVTGETALLHAAATGQLNIVKLLLRYGADPDIQQESRVGMPRRDGDSPCSPYKSALHAAAAKGYDQIVKELLACGAEIELEDENGLRPLHFAAQSGHSEIAKYLLDHLCLPQPKDVNGRTPLHLAARAGELEIVKLLLATTKVDANVVDKRRRTPLSYACENQQEDVVEALLGAVKNADGKDIEGKTPLSYAAACGNARILRLLLSRREVRVNSQDQEGSSPLLHARHNGHQSVVQLLEFAQRQSLVRD